MRTLLLVIVAAAAGSAAMYFGQPYLPPSIQQKQLVNVSEGTGKPKTSADEGAPPKQIYAVARLEPESEIIGVGGPAGSRIDRYAEIEDKTVEGGRRPLREGDVVKKNEPLVYLDSHAEMLAARNHAEKMLSEAKKSLEAETVLGNANITVAQEKIREADEVAPLGIKAQESEVGRSEAELKKLEKDAERSEKMLKDNAISQSMHDSAKLLVIQAEKQLSRNKHMLKQMEKDQQVKLSQAKAQLESAKAGKTRAELMAQVASLDAALKLAEARVSRTVILAPINGEIIKIHVKEGESIGPQPILKLGDVTQMVAVAEVYETEARHVKSGQKATITSKSFAPGTELTGTVERISKLVHKNDVLRVDPTAAADARVIETRIKLDRASPASGYNYMQVDVQIKIGE
jgi:HlyD family secretion protein